MNCKTCKHWCGLIYPDDTALEGPCSLIIPESGQGDSQKLFWVNVETSYPEFIEGVFLNTNAEFGCNLWESKNE